MSDSQKKAAGTSAPDQEMLENLDLLMDMDITENESEWSSLEELPANPEDLDDTTVIEMDLKEGSKQ